MDHHEFSRSETNTLKTRFNFALLSKSGTGKYALQPKVKHKSHTIDLSQQVGFINIYAKSIPPSPMYTQVLTQPEIEVITVCLTVDQDMVKAIAKHFLL